MRLSDYPQLSPLLNGIRSTLAGDRPALEKHFQLTLNGQRLKLDYHLAAATLRHQTSSTSALRFVGAVDNMVQG